MHEQAAPRSIPPAQTTRTVAPRRCTIGFAIAAAAANVGAVLHRPDDVKTFLDQLWCTNAFNNFIVQVEPV